MKVVLVVTGLPSQMEPARSVFNLIFAKELVAAGNDVTIVYLRGISAKRSVFRKAVVDGIRCFEFSLLGPFNTSAMFTLSLPLISHILIPSEVRKYLEKCDIIHAISGGSLTLAYELSKVFDKPYIGQFIGTDVNVHLAADLRKERFRKALERSSALCFESKALLNTFRDKTEIGKALKVYYRGIKTDEFDFVFPEKNHVSIVFLGGFRKDDENLKGGITLLNAINRLCEYPLGNKQFEIRIGGPNSKEYYDRIRSDIPHQIKVDFIGAIGREQVKTELQNSHVVIIPSLFEGLPNMLFEGMSSGNLVIASRAGGIPEVITNGENGILVDCGDEVALAEAIFNNADLDLIERLSINARECVENYHYNSFLNNYINLYKASVRRSIES